MAFIIPFIFQAGTKAKSNEVNQNFLAVKQFVDLLEEDVANNQLGVYQLQNNKANLNGDASQRFQAANAIVGKDVVNKDTLEAETKNARGYIDGYILSYTSKVITASKGSCYDSELEYLIDSLTSLQLTPSALAVDTTYNLFVCGDSSGTNNPQLTHNTGEIPSLPSGTNIYRKIGYFVTDGDAKIIGAYANNEKAKKPTVGFIGSLIKSIQGSTVGGGKTYKEVATSDCWVYGYLSSDDSNVSLGIAQTQGGSVSNVGRFGTGGSAHGETSTCLFPLKKGQELVITSHWGTNFVINMYGMV